MKSSPEQCCPRSPILPAAASTISAADTTASPVAAVQTQSVTEKRAQSPIPQSEPAKRRCFLNRYTFSQEKTVELDEEMHVQTKVSGECESGGGTFSAEHTADVIIEATLT